MDRIVLSMICLIVLMATVMIVLDMLFGAHPKIPEPIDYSDSPVVRGACVVHKLDHSTKGIVTFALSNQHRVRVRFSVLKEDHMYGRSELIVVDCDEEL